MIGFGGYLAGWILYIISVFGLYYFTLRFLGRWRNLLVFKLICSLGAALLLAPWHIETPELNYWAPAVITGFIDGVSDSPEAIVEYTKPIVATLIVFWLVVIPRHFSRKKKKTAIAEVSSPEAGSESA